MTHVKCVCVHRNSLTGIIISFFVAYRDARQYVSIQGLYILQIVHMHTGIFVPYAVHGLISTYRSHSFFWPNSSSPSAHFSSLWISNDSVSLAFIFIPPIPCFSCMHVRRRHSQYTRDTYFWHLKVTAERQAFDLSAECGGKSTHSGVRTCLYPSMCAATFQMNETWRIPDVALFALLL